MDKKQKKRILKAARKHAKQAKKAPKTNLKVTLKSGNTSPLAKVINTKEKADFFMTILRALDPSNARS